MSRASISRSTRSPGRRISNLADHMLTTDDTHNQFKDPYANVQWAMVETYQLIERLLMNAISPIDEKTLKQNFMKTPNALKVEVSRM